ncbi:MAG TPA: PH domain-containing protein [Actinomycetota bacterium]|nr:PH domain-containing protein [Actinomycetota bacterium]
MAFPRALLADHERIVFELRPHWVAVVPALLWAALIVVAWVALGALTDSGPALVALSAGALIALLVLSAVPLLKWSRTLFVLTTDRLITRRGVIAREATEIPLERINDVAFKQSALERLVGAGDLLIESAGERGQTRITNVKKPEQVQLRIYQATEENSNRMLRSGQPFPTPDADNIPEQIEALARLKVQGVITEAEFETKKKELLDRL